MKYEWVQNEAYGQGVYTSAAARLRMGGGVTPGQNIATFHFTRREKNPTLCSPDVFPDLVLTATSTGVGVMVEYGIHGKKARVNDSHSEYQFFHFNERLVELKRTEDWPRIYVLDWVFTERPACGGAWAGAKRVQAGCATLIGHYDEYQRERRWDSDGGGDEPFGESAEHEITVYSMFGKDSATADIRTALAEYKRTLKERK
ncbi:MULTISPECIES: hypothetical protein [unclassified Streptosporangium]|uniref:hypothetical protein n=1 Tax=Streptosporangium sp. NPDC005286 TaxID=3154463 RepID=UPI0033A5959A